MNALRPNLGEITTGVFAIARRVGDFYDDPMTRASGCADELAPMVVRDVVKRVGIYLAEHDLTIETWECELRARTTDRWVYFSGASDVAGMLDHLAVTP